MTTTHTFDAADHALPAQDFLIQRSVNMATASLAEEHLGLDTLAFTEALIAAGLNPQGATSAWARINEDAYVYATGDDHANLAARMADELGLA